MKDNTSLSDIKRLKGLEDFLGLKLPQDYRNFLLEHNGKKFLKNTFEISKGEYSVVHHVYRLSNDNDYFDLLNAYKNKRSTRFEENNNFLVIADDNVGNYVILSLELSTFGEIYFYDNDTLGNNYTKLANSFEEFYSSLFDLQETSVYENLVDEALDKKDIQLLKLALEQGYDIENLDKYGRNLIERSVISGDIDLIEFVLELQPEARNSISIAEENYRFFKDEYAPILAILKKHYKI